MNPIWIPYLNSYIHIGRKWTQFELKTLKEYEPNVFWDQISKFSTKFYLRSEILSSIFCYDFVSVFFHTCKHDRFQNACSAQGSFVIVQSLIILYYETHFSLSALSKKRKIETYLAPSILILIKNFIIKLIAFAHISYLFKLVQMNEITLLMLNWLRFWLFHSFMNDGI